MSIPEGYADLGDRQLNEILSNTRYHIRRRHAHDDLQNQYSTARAFQSSSDVRDAPGGTRGRFVPGPFWHSLALYMTTYGLDDPWIYINMGRMTLLDLDGPLLDLCIKHNYTCLVWGFYHNTWAGCDCFLTSPPRHGLDGPEVGWMTLFNPHYSMDWMALLDSCI